eukprot:4364783-Pyramimonas_sp.AAC.1
MRTPPAFQPQKIGTTPPAHKLSDGRFGPDSHRASTYTAMCDTCPPGSPLLVWAAGSPALGCFMWRPEPGAPCNEQTGPPPWGLMPTLWTQQQWNA